MMDTQEPIGSMLITTIMFKVIEITLVLPILFLMFLINNSRLVFQLGKILVTPGMTGHAQHQMVIQLPIAYAI